MAVNSDIFLSVLYKLEKECPVRRQWLCVLCTPCAVFTAHAESYDDKL